MDNQWVIVNRQLEENGYTLNIARVYGPFITKQEAIDYNDREFSSPDLNVIVRMSMVN